MVFQFDIDRFRTLIGDLSSESILGYSNGSIKSVVDAYTVVAASLDGLNPDRVSTLVRCRDPTTIVSESIINVNHPKT